MAQEVNFQDRISSDAAVLAGKPVVRGTSIPVERVLAYLAENLEPDDVFAEFPELSRDDIKAVLTYARAVVETVKSRETVRSPESFYRSLTQRPDVRKILERLAK
ncbi:MAG: DUF433 domain-containing protein [Chloroflexi bacterium]|nr:DUF433 domain-containing protein [Chloroflexota bacterium]